MNMFDPFARYYEADYGTFSDDIVLYRELARLQGGAVLALMCGTGRVAIPLAQAGLSVTGVDVSPAMLAQAQQRAASVNVAVQWHNADARTFALDQQFGTAFVATNSFMHLETAADQRATLQRIHQHLAPDGMLILDLFNPDPVYLSSVDGAYVLDKTFRAASGNMVQKFVARSVDLAQQQIAVTFCYDEIHPDGRVERTVLPFGMRWVYRFEAEYLLECSGFAVESIYGSYDLDAYTSDAPRLIVVARRIDEDTR